MFRHSMALRQVCSRSFSSSVRRQVENKVPDKQKWFQDDNGIPVHLKGGFKDVFLYKITMALTVAGTGAVLFELYNAAMPKKK
ncbi:cytochrome c oxidase subunit 7A2a [Salminus brasiliensis]|uniref:cytochrome c oxidase subunit 7A2a n=1 Tax=Salminus brasiliensis TaxID=930266 RepID=UPI003B835E32